MPIVRLSARNDLAEWRTRARPLLAAGVSPDAVAWVGPDGDEPLFAGDEAAPAAVPRQVSVPKPFFEMAEAAICHVDPTRFDRLYRFAFRLVEDRDLMGVASDTDLVALREMASAVRRDSHKMKAFVRFREVLVEGETAAAGTCDDSATESPERAGQRFLAWFEPDHYVLERTAPFFERRFTGMAWGIVTPYASAYWDGTTLSFGPGGNKADVPAEDAMETAWKTYFASIFNPARLKVSMMKSEMPVKYWRNLPEAELIAPLIRGARAAEREMIEKAATQPPSRHVRQAARSEAQEQVPETVETIEEARAAIHSCRRCPLYEHATQPVFGAGGGEAEVMFVGEQPGDQEDLAGQPFVGPAGQVFDKALAEVGIDRGKVYVTNAVKHFKFVARGKRRIHQKPDTSEVAACRYWLETERALVKPKTIVALGATAAMSLLGRTVTISRTRGEAIALPDGTTLFVTNHPSYILRIPNAADAEAERARFVADLRLVGQHTGLIEG